MFSDVRRLMLWSVSKQLYNMLRRGFLALVCLQGFLGVIFNTERIKAPYTSSPSLSKQP